MRSFCTVAGVLAAVAPAAAVPQQYTGWYPMPNATHSHPKPWGTGVVGTGIYPHYTPTWSVSATGGKPSTTTETSTRISTSTTTETSTRISTSTNTKWVTVHPSSGSGSGNGSPASQVSPPHYETETIGSSVGSVVQAAETVCGSGAAQAPQTVTITEKVRETITVTQSGIQEQGAPSYSTTFTRLSVDNGHSTHDHSHFHHPSHKPTFPVGSSVTKPWTYPNGTTTRYPIGTGTGVPSFTWSPTWTHPSSTYTPPSSTVTPPSSTVTPPSSTDSPTSVPTFTSSTSTSSTTSPTASPTSYPSTGKRGISYNDASMADAFEGSPVSWAYNWGSSSDGLPSQFEYVPMLWGNSEDFTGSWTDNANAAIESGSTAVLGFNECDLSTQANMDAGTAASAFKQYITPLAGKVRLGSPSVTNGAAPMGIAWLTDFLSQCSDCNVDFVAIHWYDAASNAQYFKDHVTEAHQQTGLPVWVTEFGATGSDDEISAFLEDVMGWMDDQDFVEKYAYFMASDGLLNSGSGLSAYGNTYASGSS